LRAAVEIRHPAQRLSGQAGRLDRPDGFANAAQRQRWTAGDFASRTRAIASDFHFYEIMATHGFDRPATDRCLANKALADKLAKGTQDAVDKDFVTGTPSFVLNGVPLSAYTWEALKPQIEARLH
jgi:2-hydroxychromene-2-carboxylate isomerase